MTSNERLAAKRTVVRERLAELHRMDSTGVLIGMMDEWKVEMLILVLGIGHVEID